jgi:SAM-dependent methyltransferase
MSRDSYDHYMGRYSERLAPELISFVPVKPGMRALDVGCGPGALTEALAGCVGAANVAGADPSQSLLAACADRVPGADVRQAFAQGLPWPSERFDVVISQLVMNFLPDADAGLLELCRVVRPGGAVSCCTWDYSDGMQMLRTFWDAALEFDQTAPDEGRVMRYCTEDELAALWLRNALAVNGPCWGQRRPLPPGGHGCPSPFSWNCSRQAGSDRSDTPRRPCRHRPPGPATTMRPRAVPPPQRPTWGDEGTV